MKLAIIGLSNSGKTTIFNALTGQNIETTVYPSISGEPNLGVVKVPDYRVDALVGIYKPKKITYAAVEYIDFIGLTKGDVSQNRKVFDLIKDADAVVHVVRAFEDQSVSHPMNMINPMSDIEIIELELILGDLEFIEKRLVRIAEAEKKGKKQNDEEKRLLLKCKEALDNETPLRNLNFNADEKKAMSHLQFVSIKPMIVVLNINEQDLKTGRPSAIQAEAEGFYNCKSTSETTKAATLCGKVEMEIAQLSPDDAKAFLDDLEIKEPALNRLINVSYDLLGLISFLTVGEDEVRAWTIARGLSAQKAAGKIHSDIERGFIRAEVINYDDFISCGSMSSAKDKGLLRLEGKTYEVKDGDIINFRFNV